MQSELERLGLSEVLVKVKGLYSADEKVAAVRLIQEHTGWGVQRCLNELRTLMEPRLDSVDKLIDEAIESYIFTSCKDYGCSSEDFNPNYLKTELIERLTEGLLEELHPRGPHQG